jgi:hypothetical protein
MTVEPCVLRNTVDEELICRTLEVPDRDELKFADNLNPSPRRNPFHRQWDDGMSLEGQPKSQGCIPEEVFKGFCDALHR